MSYSSSQFLDKRQSNSDQASGMHKMPWTQEEDEKVIQLVKEHGPHKWTFIAEHLPMRIGKQCRERWHNHLNPKIKKEPWSDQEEWLLYLVHKAIGNKWAEIVKVIPGRTDNSIKNHWNSAMRKRIPELYARFIEFRDLWPKNQKTLTKDMPKVERELLEQLFALGTLDFHSQNGLNPDVTKAPLRISRVQSTHHPEPVITTTKTHSSMPLTPKKIAKYQELYGKMLKSKKHRNVLEQLKIAFKTDKLSDIINKDNMSNSEIVKMIQKCLNQNNANGGTLPNISQSLKLGSENKEATPGKGYTEQKKSKQGEISVFEFESPATFKHKDSFGPGSSKKKELKASTNNPTMPDFNFNEEDHPAPIQKVMTRSETSRKGLEEYSPFGISKKRVHATNEEKPSLTPQKGRITPRTPTFEITPTK